MRIQDFHTIGGQVCILGYGKEGQSAARMLRKYAPDVDITVADGKPDLAVPGMTVISGSDYLERTDVGGFTAIIKSPGIPPHPLIDKWRAEGRLTSGTQIFLDSVAGTGATVIGVTGSKGKSTTSALLHALLTAGGKDALLVGNIGIPVIEHADQGAQGKIFVQELSSYQLMDLTRSPHIAVVTSFFPEHLDYHGSLEAYKEAKKHIARFQGPQDAVFYNAKSPGAVEIGLEGKGEKIPFSDDDSPVRIEETRLIGRHNLSNIAGACKVAARFGVAKETCKAVLKDFEGLPHRLQSLGMHHGIEWIDDAISTTPDSTIAALDALGDRVHTIILGGQDRGVPFTELGKRIAASPVRTVILFPGSGPRIRQSIGDAKADVCFHEAFTMEDAVKAAKKKTPEGGICLLSTASPSYNMFKNFEEKGEHFQACILA